MQPSRNLVGVLVEFSSRTNLCHDYFKGRDPFLFMHAHGNTATIVFSGNGIVFVNDDLDQIAMTGQGLIDGVINNFVDQVMQSSNTDISDVHGGTHAHMLHSF